MAAYRAMWRDAAVVSRTPDPKDPRLDDHARKKALWLLQYLMERLQTKGAASAGEMKVAPRVVKSTAAKVELLDCTDDSDWLEVERGAPSDGLSTGHYRTEATVVLASGKWMVSDLYSEAAGSCMG
ncbi:hypothetical protein [Streptomyces sp. NPDC058247]|uniref:hypothetical protein n=1 Tax=Streptomyces sp. NPDC058247 TaxID=3346401 RepID=UPI0036F17238